MKDKEYNDIITTHNHRLIRIDSQKKFVEQMIKDLNKQYADLSDDWDETWRSRQYYVNKEEEESSDPMDDYNYVGSKDHY
jgi:ArsR family metal-binding transcriptional regulator